MIWRVDLTPLPVSRSRATANETYLDGIDQLEFTPVDALPHIWGKRFEQRWWKVAVPPAESSTGDDVPRYLCWRDQGEATAYYNGQAVAGIDPGHVMMRLPETLVKAGGELLIESICCRTGVWVPGAGQGISQAGSVFNGAFLATRDDDAWAASFDVEVLFDLALALHRRDHPLTSDLPSAFGYRAPIEHASPVCRRILDGLDRAVDALDHEGPAAMQRVTQKLLNEFPADATAMPATLTGHAHIDLVWLWPERTGEFKAVHSLANVLDVQKRYPEMVFGYTQPASYEAVQRRAPELYERVLERVKQGGFEPVGAMYVESDTQLPCGEALVRAFELGQEGFRKLRADGRDSPIVWLPDVFGYSAALPTIMAGFGVPYFYTTKMHWSSATKIPFSSFRWAGMDGSEVVTHLSWNFYNLDGQVKEMQWPVDQHRQAAVHHETLITLGYGDGGGGPNDAMCERARRMENLAGLPRCQWGTIEGFFDRLDAVREELPVWQGEMYLEGHRGVQTTQAQLKAEFRRVERNLQIREAAACLTGQPTDAATDHAWRRIVFAQFHDYIPGSSVPEVYEEHLPELRRLADAVEADTLAALQGVAGVDAAEPCWFNPLPVERVVEADGRLLRLPPLSATACDDAARVKKLKPTQCQTANDGSASMRQDRTRIEFNPRGEITSMVVDGRLIALKSPAGQLFSFPDHPAKYDAWDIDYSTLANGRPVTTDAHVRIEDVDAFAPELVFERSVGKSSRATIRYRLLPGQPAVGVQIDLDWQEPQTLLKWVAPTAYVGRQARFGAPYGSVLRPQTRGPLANEAMFEVPGSRWAAVADDTERDGFMIVTEAKYGFGCCDGLLHFSLIRSPLLTGHGGNDEGNDSANAGETCSDLGQHSIRFAVGRYDADAPRDELPAMLADTLFTPAIRVATTPGSTGLMSITGGASLIPAWCKPADAANDGYTLRLHETLGRRGQTILELAPGLVAKPVDLKGDDVDHTTTADGDRVLIDFKPYQIISLRIRRDS